MQKKNGVTTASDNLFADFGFRNPEEMQLKAELSMQILLLVERLGLTQAQVAERLGTHQPKISRLLRGELSGFSIGRLIRYLNALGQDVEIVVREKPNERAQAVTTVAAA